MAKQNHKALPLRKPRDRSRDEESILVRSAESLGRVIGSLQRQLEGAAKRMSASAGDVVHLVSPRADVPRQTPVRRAKARKSSARAAAAMVTAAKSISGLHSDSHRPAARTSSTPKTAKAVKASRSATAARKKPTATARAGARKTRRS